MAALVGTRLMHFVMKVIPVPNISVFMWSDSQIALHWIKNKKSLPVFVWNRVTEMNSLLPDAVWNYCPDNPVDLLMRRTTTELLMSSHLWKNSPKWLTTPDHWPSHQLPPLPPLVLAAEVATEFVPMEQAPPELGLHHVISIEHHGSLTKLF